MKSEKDTYHLLVHKRDHEYLSKIKRENFINNKTNALSVVLKEHRFLTKAKKALENKA